MEHDDIVELSGFLSDFTGTPVQYYFAVWDGYGSLSVGASALMTTSGGIPLLPSVDVEKVQRIGSIFSIRGSRLSMTSSTSPDWTAPTSGGRRTVPGACPRT